MTPQEREQSERQRKFIAAANRAANRPRPARVIPAADRDAEIMERAGFTYYKDDRGVDWAALTRS
jgi:hypothetical protein